MVTFSGSHGKSSTDADFCVALVCGDRLALQGGHPMLKLSQVSDFEHNLVDFRPKMLGNSLPSFNAVRQNGGREEHRYLFLESWQA